jgi:hypothetical protein
VPHYIARRDAITWSTKALNRPFLLAPEAGVWLARVCVAAVLLSNLQCAVAFWLDPAAYTPAFQLAGAVGDAVLRGIAVLFVMWNVPYIVAVTHPTRHRMSLFESVAMQALGTAGETAILFMVPPGLSALRSALIRFILFDGAGLLVLLGAVALTRRHLGPSRS